MSSTSGKIIIVVGLVFSLLMAVGIGGGVYWWSKNKDQVLGQFEDHVRGQFTEKRKEWVAFGRSTDNEGCFAESLRQHDTCGTFPCHLKNNLFLFQCLEASIPTPGFCDDVPPKAEFMKTVTWRVSECFEVEREGSYCNQLFGTLQRFCGRQPRWADARAGG